MFVTKTGSLFLVYTTVAYFSLLIILIHHQLLSESVPGGGS